MRVEVFKTTQTHADVLLATGVATFMFEATGKQGDDTKIFIESQGPCFVVTGDVPEDYSDWTPSPGYPFIKDDKHDPGEQFPAAWPILDYIAERQRAGEIREFKRLEKQIGKTKRKIESQMASQEIAVEGPSPLYRIALFMASIRKGWNGDRELALWLARNPDEGRAGAEHILNGTFAPPAGFNALSASQILTPSAGKGVHRPKPDSTAPSAISNALVNPLETWARIRGVFVSLLPYRSGDDYRVYSIVPGKISLAALRTLHNHMLSKEIWGSLRVDIFALLELLRLLVEHSDVMSEAPTAIPIRRNRPAQVIQGLTLAIYKSLGSSYALIHAAFLGTPSWFPLETREDGEAYLRFVEEAIGSPGQTGCLGTLREDNSGDISILQSFREWLLREDLALLLDFLVSYGERCLERRGRKDFAKEWSIGVLEPILRKGYAMQTEEIVSNPGFANIARAIRNSTIYAASLPDSRREIRYGLAQEWKQKIKGGAEAFLPVLADFVQQYNWETVHTLEGKGYVITTQDLDEVVKLIDKHGVETVGMLLLAYGFARAPRTSAEEGAAPPSEPTELAVKI